MERATVSRIAEAHTLALSMTGGLKPSDSEDFRSVSEAQRRYLVDVIRRACESGEAYAEENSSGELIVCYGLEGRTFRIGVKRYGAIVCEVDYSTHESFDVRAFWNKIAAGDYDSFGWNGSNHWRRVYATKRGKVSR